MVLLEEFYYFPYKYFWIDLLTIALKRNLHLSTKENDDKYSACYKKAN